MRSNILGLFVNKLSSDDKDTLLNGDNLMQRIQMQISKKQKIFAEFFSGFPNLDQIFKILKKLMTIIAYPFPKLLAAKNVVGQMSKKSRCRRPFNKQHNKRSQTLFKVFTAAPLSYLSITLKEIELEKVSLSDM